MFERLGRMGRSIALLGSLSAPLAGCNPAVTAAWKAAEVAAKQADSSGARGFAQRTYDMCHVGRNLKTSQGVDSFRVCVNDTKLPEQLGCRGLSNEIIYKETPSACQQLYRNVLTDMADYIRYASSVK